MSRCRNLIPCLNENSWIFRLPGKSQRKCVMYVVPFLNSWSLYNTEETRRPCSDLSILFYIYLKRDETGSNDRRKHSLNVISRFILNAGLFKCAFSFYLILRFFTVALSELENNRVNYLHNLINLCLATGG